MTSGRQLLRLEQIDKRFPGVHALDRVDFDLYEGEVHVLLGENGAGKSTLMKILSGLIRKDGGRVFVHGKEVGDLNPELAQALGIGMVYQELSLIPGLSVAENMFLGGLPRNRLGMVEWRHMQKQAKDKLADLGVHIDPKVEVRKLDVAEQQLTEIARILAKQPKILLLDEPTSALSDAERERLFEIIRRLRARGVGIIYISHLLGEVPLIGQRVTVLRDGRVVGTHAVDDADEGTLISMMVGRQLAEQYPKSPADKGKPILRIESLALAEVFNDLSFELHKGEILGIFGLMGAGQPELARALFGLEPGLDGRIFVEGVEAEIRGPADAIKLGLGFLTRDRRQGIVPMLPIPPNTSLASLAQFGLLKLLNLKQEEDSASKYVRELRIQPPSLRRLAIYLSGGNQQKVILSRWLSSNARILIFDEPTRGIDVGAKTEVFMLMNRLVQQGVGIVMISSEMPELLAMTDRILVMRKGEFTAEFQRDEADQETLLRCAS
ncbi:MAG: sugar ABC transporter ATP-binding protein [Alphaproteobacteria bacterium]